MLDKQLEFILKLSRGQNLKKIHEMDISEARENATVMAQTLNLASIDLEKIEEIVIKREDDSLLRLRSYFSDSEVDKPILVFYHGGGYALYDIDSHDSLCRYFCKKLNCNVIAVEYRRSPEHVYPAAINDAILGTKWVMENIDRFNGDKNNVILGGDSVGGQLALSVNEALYSEYKIRMLLLLYPVINFQKNYASYTAYGENYFLDTKTMDWFEKMHFQGNAIANEILKKSYLRKDLITYIAIAEFDVLKDSSVEFVQHLLRNKANVYFEKFDELPHNFALMAGKIKSARKALDKICITINEIITN